MPIAPPRVCSTCGQTACTVHVRQAWTHREEPKRIRGRALQRLRDKLFRSQPMCVICNQSPSTIRDHIIPLAEGGLDVAENTQGLCRRCSDEKTARESQRGRVRNT